VFIFSAWISPATLRSGERGRFITCLIFMLQWIAGKKGGEFSIGLRATAGSARTHARFARRADAEVHPYTSPPNSLGSMDRLDLLASATKDRSKIFLLRGTVSTRCTKPRYTGATFIICPGLCRTPKRGSSATPWQRPPKLHCQIRLLFFISQRLSMS